VFSTGLKINRSVVYTNITIIKITTNISGVSKSCLARLRRYPKPLFPPNNSAVNATFHATPKLILIHAKRYD